MDYLAHPLSIFFFNDPPTTEIYTLSLHDALPIFAPGDLKARFALIREIERQGEADSEDRKSTRLNSSHSSISYAVFCLKKKKQLYVTPTLTDKHHLTHL